MENHGSFSYPVVLSRPYCPLHLIFSQQVSKSTKSILPYLRNHRELPGLLYIDVFVIFLGLFLWKPILKILSNKKVVYPNVNVMYYRCHFKSISVKTTAIPVVLSAKSIDIYHIKILWKEIAGSNSKYHKIYLSIFTYTYVTFVISRQWQIFTESLDNPDFFWWITSV